jgi:hypothetical protein
VPRPPGHRAGVALRQSYLRIAKRAAMMAGRYAHAKHFNRHRRELRILSTRWGRLIRDIGRKIAAVRTLRQRLPSRWPAPTRSEASNSASLAGSSIPSTPPRPSASPKAKPAHLTSSASRSPSSPPTPAPPATTSCCTPGRCLETHTTDTPCATSSTKPKKTHRL